MRDALRAGVAIYNDGYYHAAHDAWEAHWLELETGTDDELLLHGLIQFTAAVYHATNRNWAGATGLAESAGDYLASLPETYRGVDVSAVRDELETFASDPGVIERRQPRSLTHEGEKVTLEGLKPAETFVAAAVLAEELGYEERVVEDAIEFARGDLTEGGTSDFLALLHDFLTEPETRALVFDRLEGHVARERSKRDDVSGLFDT